jgi:hypothetical protein
MNRERRDTLSVWQSKVNAGNGGRVRDLRVLGNFCCFGARLIWFFVKIFLTEKEK